MADPAVNPYAPPVEDVGSAPPKMPLWCVVDGYLAVRNEAFLPPVDLEGDGSDGPLTPVVHTHIPRRARHKGAPAQIRFRGYTSLSAFHKRARRRGAITRLTYSGLLLFFPGMFMVYFRDHLGGVLAALGEAARGIGLLAMIGAIVWDRFPGGVRCHGERDGWFYLRGVSPRSLAQFAARSQEAPVMVKRKAFRFFSHRLPLFSIVPGQRFNPIAMLIVAILKVRRSPALESLHLHHSEEARRTPDHGDPALVDQWQRETEGTEMASWRAVAAKASHPPDGMMAIESLLFISPDGKHSAALAIRRFSNGRVTAILRQAVFRSWTADQCVQTIAPSGLPIHSPWIDRLKTKGKLPRLFERHLAHVGDRTLIAIQSDAELFALLDRESEEEYATFQAAGFQAPLEVMEFPEYPAFGHSTSADSAAAKQS